MIHRLDKKVIKETESSKNIQELKSEFEFEITSLGQLEFHRCQSFIGKGLQLYFFL